MTALTPSQARARRLQAEVAKRLVESGVSRSTIASAAWENWGYPNASQCSQYLYLLGVRVGKGRFNSHVLGRTLTEADMQEIRSVSL